MRHASIRFAVAAALAAFVPALPALAGNMSLSIDGITMSIEILSYNFSAKNPATLGTGSGGGTGKVTFSDFTFTATESSASPILFNYVDSGRHSQGARLSVLNPDTGKPQSEWVLTDVLVTSFGVQNGALDPKAKQPNTFAVPVTAFGLTFERACYRVFAADGSVAQEACWNVATNSTT